MQLVLGKRQIVSTQRLNNNKDINIRDVKGSALLIAKQVLLTPECQTRGHRAKREPKSLVSLTSHAPAFCTCLKSCKLGPSRDTMDHDGLLGKDPELPLSMEMEQ